MSSHEHALASVVSQLALSFDGAVIGVALAYAAVRSILKFKASSRALRKIRKAPSVTVADLRSLLTASDHEEKSQKPNQSPPENSLVIVRGQVEPKPAAGGAWTRSLNRSVLVSHESGDKAVIVQRTQTCIYNEWRGFLGWTSDLRVIFGKSFRAKESISTRMVPFILVDSEQMPQSDFVVVNMDGSRHPLPLMTVYHHLQPIEASPYTFLQALFGHEYPVGLLDEEKILPPGKIISAVGTCSHKNGGLEIKSSKDIPYFLSEMSKDQMVADLSSKTTVLLWSGVILGSLSIGILCFAAYRNWNRWKAWRQQRESRQQIPPANNRDASQMDTDDEDGDVPDGQLCVICLMRRRRAAFVPCGHLVCCGTCAISLEREVSPKCPLCRQAVRNLIRIYDS